MSGRIYPCINGSSEYELYCDGCGASFQCHDDSFLSWPVLCSAAEAEGWAVDPHFDGEHECHMCAETTRSSRQQAIVAAAAALTDQ